MQLPITESGRLIHKVSIQRRQRTQSQSSGDMTEVWADIKNAWAEIKPLLRGRNVEIAAGRTKGRTITHQITMRYPGMMLTPADHRIAYRGRVFELFAVNNTMERNVELVIECNEIIQ
jgi:SPP1 family predicted phage head-tail adaptor